MPAVAAVLEKGEVEAGALWEAYVSRLLVSGRFRVIMVFREELGKLLGTNVFPAIGLWGLEPWIKTNPDGISKLRAVWTQAYQGVQQDEAHFRRYAEQFFGLEKSDELALGWQRTRTFLLPGDFRWPDATSVKALKTYLREGGEMGMFPIEGVKHIDSLFVP